MSQEKPGSQKMTLIVALIGLGGVIAGSICGVLNGPAAAEVVKYVLYGTPTVVATDSPPTPTFTCTPTATTMSILVAKPTPHKPPTKTPTPTNTPASTPTPTATPTPMPDAVVNAKALNLRSGPGEVYDILTVLKQGDSLKVVGKSPDDKWLKVTSPGGQEGWVAAWHLQINLLLAEVALAPAPPTPTPAHTPTPTATPTPKLYPAPFRLETKDGVESFTGWVSLRWQWDGQLKEKEYFSIRVWKEGEEEPCHHTQIKEREYSAGLSHCSHDGKHYWSVAVVEKTEEGPPPVWENRSKDSEQQWFNFIPGSPPDEPWGPKPPETEPTPERE